MLLLRKGHDNESLPSKCIESRRNITKISLFKIYWKFLPQKKKKKKKKNKKNK